MRFTIVDPVELGPAERRRWAELQYGDDRLGNAFLDAGFAVAVARSRRDARVAVIEDAGEIVGFFAFQRDRFGIGRPIGAGVCDCQALIRADTTEIDGRALLEACGLTSWEFDHLLAHQQEFVPQHRGIAGSPIVDLRDGFDAYIEGRRAVSRKLVKTVAQQRRRLAREVGELRFEPHTDEPQALRTLLDWKSAQYRRTGRPDVFANAWLRRLLDALQADSGSGFGAVVSTLWAGDRPVSVHLGLRSPTMLASWFPAYDPELAKYSPGTLLVLQLAEDAAAQGLDHIDLGKGQADYKDRLKSREVVVAQGWVTRRSLPGMARAGRLAATTAAGDWVRSHPAALTTARRVQSGLRRA